MKEAGLIVPTSPNYCMEMSGGITAGYEAGLLHIQVAFPQE